jgi:membrane glycosyltransferase
VSAYLGAVAPIPAGAIRARTAELLGELPEDVATEDAVAHAQARVASWWRVAFDSDDLADAPARRALASIPEAFLSTDAAELEALRGLRQRLIGGGALPPQPLAGHRLRFLAGLAPAGLVGGALASTFASVVHAPAYVLLPWTLVFGLLCFLQATSATLAILGLVRRRRVKRAAAVEAAPLSPEATTAIVVPVYEEDPQRVFASIAAMREALIHTQKGDSFAFYVLSDTQDPLRAADEERAWRRLAALAAGRIPIYYRRRPQNVGKKAGNVAEFAARNVDRFRYAVMLDADSLMGAELLVAMVARMEASPRLGLLQAPIDLRGGETVFARSLQLAHALGGPLLTHGLAAFSGADGNYFGHNAILRLSAFVECCGLPNLAGAPPFGGPILSHDFVEAALLRRGGWEVRLGDDLVGESFEEPPPTFADYLTRDRRWCQGNLQHLRLVATHGFSPQSRLHLLFGALAYLASPLWACFLALGVASRAAGGRLALEAGVGLALAAVALVLLPRALGLIDAILRRRREFGGLVRLVLGAALELAISAVLAPALMVAQTGFVLSIATGGAVDWGAQRRTARSVLGAIDRRTVFISAMGVASGAALSQLDASLAALLAPIWLAWALALPTTALLAHRGFGRLLRRAGILATPAEVRPPAIVRAARRHVDYFHPDELARFRDVVLDPVLNARRRAQLAKAGRAADGGLSPLARRAIERGPAALAPEERARLLDDAEALLELHVGAWRAWPVEVWDLPRPVHLEGPSRGGIDGRPEIGK